MRFSRVLIIGALVLCWMGASVVGATSVGLRTESGRRALVRMAVAVANRAINGTLTIGEVGGSLLSGLEVVDVVVRGPDGDVVMEIPRLEVGYGLRDLLRGRIVLGRLTVDSPRLVVARTASGASNLAQVFALGGGGAGPAPLVAFSNVEITNGSVEVRTPLGDSTIVVPESEASALGPVRVRRFTDINGSFPYLRLASPFRSQAVCAEVARLDLRASDPEFTLAGLRGVAEFQRDTVTIDLAEATLPDSGVAVRGMLAWDSGAPLLNLSLRLARTPSDAVRQLISEVPPGMRVTGDFDIRSVNPDLIDLRGEELDLVGIGRGGRARGRLGLSVGPASHVTFRRTTLDVENFDLEYVRQYFDTLPIAGRVTGRFEANGPTEQLELGLDLSFSDSLLPGWPATTLRSDGVVSLGGEGALVFRDYRIRNARFDLETVRRLLPSVDLQGFMRGSGTLNGPWLQVGFDGQFTHRDASLPESTARGSVRIDGRGDTLGLWADVVFDSLRLEGLRSSYPDFDVGGSFGGRVVLAGYFDSLAATAQLAGPAGSLAIQGALELLPDRRRAHDLVVDATGLNLTVLNARLPETSLAGHLTGAGGAAQGRGLMGLVGVELESSTIKGVAMDSARLVVGVADSTLRLDGFQLWGNRLSASGNGRIGLSPSREGELTLFTAVDSLGALEPMLASFLGRLDTSLTERPAPSGSLWSSLRLEGSVQSFDLAVEVEVDQIERGNFRLGRGAGEGSWSTRRREVRFSGFVDSLSGAGWAIGDTDVGVSGAVIDSLNWELRTRQLGPDGALIAGGRLYVDSSHYAFPIDSMLVLLASGVWSVDTGAVIAVSDEAVDFRRVVARHVLGRGEVTVAGRLPFKGPGDLAGTVVGLPLQDVWAVLQKGYEEVDGQIGGSVSLSGTARAPIIEASMTLQDGMFRTFRAPYVEGRIRYSDQRLIGDVELWRRGERILTFDVALPVDLSLSEEVERRRLPGEISVRALADSIDLSILELATPAVQRVAGTLDADVGITGTWEEPQLTGSITLTNGSGSIPALGVRHRDLNGRFRLSGDTIRVEQLSLMSGPGRAELTGFVQLEELSRPILQLEIAARDFHAIDVRDFMTVTASADVRLRGPVYQARLTGRGTVTEGVLYFADLVEKDVIDLEEFAQDPLFGELIDPEIIRQQGLGAEFENRFLDSLRVDSLRLGMGRDVWLRSSEANIQLQGTVTVDKERREYRLTGTLETPRGTYRLQPRFVGELITREFAVTRGQLTYFGTPDLNASLDIDARHLVRTMRGDNVTVFVHIGGTIYDPRLTLTSDIVPPISEAEIISYLFFGAPSAQAWAQGQGSAQDQVVNQFLGALSGQAEYFLISDLRIPLDYLQIRPGVVGTGLSGTEIALGKRFGDRWFVTVSPRLCPRESFFDVQNVGASLEYRFSRRWLLSVSGDPAQSCQTFLTSNLRYQLGADVFWEKRY